MSDMLSLLPAAMSIAIAIAVGFFVWTALSIFRRTVEIPHGASSFELERRSLIELTNGIYRNIQPIVLDLAAIDRIVFSPSQLHNLRDDLIAGGEVTPWEPEEFIAVKQIEGIMAGLVVGAISILQVKSVLIALIIAVIVAGIYQSIAIAAVHSNAATRLRSIKMRLPFVIDLMALIIEAGGTFHDSLQTVVRENRGHPVGSDLARVNRQIELGRPRAKALRSFQDRFDDPDISELVFAINKGEELGTPLASVLRNQADQLRLKRSQWGEKSAAEAQVKMTFPGMLVMLACILVVLAPILLPALSAVTG